MSARVPPSPFDRSLPSPYPKPNPQHRLLTRSRAQIHFLATMVKVSGVTRAQLIRLLEAAEDGPSSRYEVKLPSSSGSLKQASFSVTYVPAQA